MNELYFSTLVLSRHHKYAEVWAHREWVVSQLIAGHPPRVYEYERDDAWIVQYCSDQHPRNYPCWAYRTSVFKLLGAVGGVEKSIEWMTEDALNFMARHVSDCSCTSFLCTVIRIQLPKWSAVLLWKRMLQFNTRLIVQSVNEGKNYGALWEARRNLISTHWQCGPLFGGWTLEEELDFVVVCCEFPGVDAAKYGLWLVHSISPVTFSSVVTNSPNA